MKKLTKIVYPRQKKDFSEILVFPGQTGNPFDKFLRLINNFNIINPFFFLFTLILLSGIGTFVDLKNWVILLIFIIFDWIIIYNLKNFQISFGHSQSQVFLLAILRIPFMWLPSPFNVIFQIIGSFLVLYGFYYEPSNIKCTNLEINKEQFKNNHKIKIIQIGDIHLERFGIRERKLLELLTIKQPDLIVFTGDFLNLSNNSDPIAIKQVIGLLNSFNNIAPTYCVSGSPAVDLSSTLKMIETNTNAHFLNDIQNNLEIKGKKLNLIGLKCTHNPIIDIQKLNLITTDPKEFNLLLYHSPDLLFEITEKNNIDLMLSGHTHGGQVRIPLLGPIFTGSLYGRIFQSGKYQYLSTYLYISRGIGFEGMGAPRVRFLCKPEIIEWTI